MIGSRVHIVLKVRLAVITVVLVAIGPGFTNRLSYDDHWINVIGCVKILLDQNKGNNNKSVVDNLSQT
ncbi:unnamed protein product [Hymenolepis diminuta]|uniref:Secreted protein n=1 Tax=Hymenolepis diminuta TaxID=6216 RepID=A0A0R3SAY0_HYMDI|nr:unnamed protein product [Hymenolepis diminuta]